MLLDYVPSEPKEEVWYEKVYDDGDNNGYGFPCDEDGNLYPMSDAVLENLNYCKSHPAEFLRSGEVVRFCNSYMDLPHGRCKCGEEVYLTGGYYGATECSCGRWYNLYGQELMPPEQWDIDPNEEEYW